MSVFRLLVLLTALISQTGAFSFSPFVHRTLLNKRAIPAGWESYGCWSDNVNQRTLTGAYYADTSKMTVESCISFCSTGGNSFIYAGLEYAEQCFCGNSLAGATNESISGCNMPCTGNAAEECGAGDLLNVYWNGQQAPTGPVTVQSTGNWAFLGCYNDSVADRVLSYAATVSSVTVESCTSACATAGYQLAGVEYSDQCFCGAALEFGSTKMPVTDCDMTCQGNTTEFCGGPNRLDVYNNTGSPAGGGGTGGSGGGSGPVTVQSTGTWEFLGCYNDSVADRVLSYGATVNSVTVESCTSACATAGYQLAGVEYSDQCFCGASLQFGSVQTPVSDCSMTCQGNATEYCGGPDRLDVYNNTAGSGSGGTGGTGGTGSGPGPVTSGLPSPWKYAACYVDNAHGRILGTEYDNTTMTIQLCISYCSSNNFTLAGVEYSDQCFCGNYLENGATIAGSDSDCDMPCDGNAAQACGGPNLVSLYSSTSTIVSYPVPTIQETNLPGSWTYKGCLNEASNGQRMFPYELIWTNNATVDACLNQCAEYGYPAAGLEYGQQCFCGDVSDVTANDGTFTADANCDFVCSGDPTHYCGGPLLLTTYYWTGTPLSVWNTPSNTGFYQFLIGGIVVPLIATVNINGKVGFLEKWGTSEFPNSTGAYELDVTLANNYQLAWREMHLQTDVFCSASIILPDKGGRQLNVGGWSLDSTYAIRLYWPDGSAGVNGTNDWEENVNEVKLQQGRWYPSMMLMANGSILVVGGESGSNAPPVPTLETLPTPEGGNTTVYLDYLQRTDPNNLYPFLMVLPSGRIFIGYYNEARILDPGTFETVVELPNMPGAVNNFLGGRTYPMEGTAVLFPQYAPYTAPIEILICGGSTPGAGIALDNCISIQPEVSNPTWTIERMPSQRVMTSIVTLPDGTYLILNGAQQGFAGFGLGSNPNLGALLYNPSQPVGQRISILGETIVARMYHSEATLLQDGRVLVSGSDPETYYPNGSYVYPEEFRIEVYVPPYLNQGFTQPSFTISQTNWNYGGQYSIVVTLHQGTTSTMRVSILAATANTHGNVMSGGRIIFPAFSCSGTTCTITAPPNANVSPPGWNQLFILDGPTPSHSQWIQIGGDPAGLGNWPNFPDFTLPGV